MYEKYSLNQITKIVTGSSIRVISFDNNFIPIMSVNTHMGGVHEGKYFCLSGYSQT